MTQLEAVAQKIADITGEEFSSAVDDVEEWLNTEVKDLIDNKGFTVEEAFEDVDNRMDGALSEYDANYIVAEHGKHSHVVSFDLSDLEEADADDEPEFEDDDERDHHLQKTMDQILDMD